MFKDTLYTFIILNIAGGLLTLLGSVSIFISLIIQRRLDRLQEILEEFINLSYRSEVNLTGQMYNLIEKYQMHYILPKGPRFLILRYIDFNVIFITVLWIFTVLINFEPPFSFLFLLQLLPLSIGIFAILFFRRLLKHSINLENPLLDNIIPAPIKLRSISYLSHFINISVKSILEQARLTLHINIISAGEQSIQGSVVLKEELSFDDFFYYLVICEEETPSFISFGEIHFNFPPDPITKKPVPACRNLNVPLGHFIINGVSEELKATFLVFTQGEKHPVQYVYQMVKGSSFFSPHSSPDITVNHQIVYSVENDLINILECRSNLPHLKELSTRFKFDRKRCFIDLLNEDIKKDGLICCEDTVFID